MHLDDDRILQRVRAELARIATDCDRPALAGRFTAIDSALHELALRQNVDAARERYRQGLALAREGVGLLPTPTAALADAVRALATDDAMKDAAALARAEELLAACLRDITVALGARTDAAGRQFLDRLCDRELALPLLRGRRAEALGRASTTDRFARDAVEDYLRQRLPQRDGLRVTRVETLSGGFSKRTLLVALEDAGGAEEIVLRANQPACNIRTDGADVRNEFGVLVMAFAAGLPLPEPLWLERDEGLFGTAFLVTRKAAGHVIGSGHTSQVFQPITPAIRKTLIRTMAQLHRVPVDASNQALAATHLARWLPHRDLRAMAIASVEYWMQELREHDIAPTPLAQRLCDWLIANAPPPLPFTPVLMHGDLGLHNILFEGERLTAVLDWEIAKIGDPAEEFIPLFLSLSTDHDAALVEEYVAAGGQPVGRFRVSWYTLLILLRIVNFEAAAAHNLASSNAADIQLFNWFTITTPTMLRNVNALMARAERERREEYGAA